MTEVCFNFFRGGEGTAPFSVWLPRKLVVMRLNVTFAAWVSILVPRPANFGGFLVDDVLIVCEVLAQSPDHIQPAGTSPNGDDANFACCSKGLLINFI